MGVNSLPKTVTRQRRNCDLNPGPSASESSMLTTPLPSHPPKTNCTSNNKFLQYWWPEAASPLPLVSNVEYVDHLHIDEFPITSPYIQHQAHYYVHYLCYIFTGQKIHSWIKEKPETAIFQVNLG